MSDLRAEAGVSLTSNGFGVWTNVNCMLAQLLDSNVHAIINNRFIAFLKYPIDIGGEIWRTYILLLEGRICFSSEQTHRGFNVISRLIDQGYEVFAFMHS